MSLTSNRLGPSVLHGQLKERWARRTTRLLTALVAASSCLVLMGLVAGRSAVFALFLERFDSMALGPVYLAVGIGLFVERALAVQFAVSWNAIRLVQAGLMTLALCLLAFQLVDLQDGPWASALGTLAVEMTTFILGFNLTRLLKCALIADNSHGRHDVMWLGASVGVLLGGLLARELGPSVVLIVSTLPLLAALGLMEGYRRLAAAWQRMHPVRGRLGAPIYADSPTRGRSVPLATLMFITILTLAFCDFYFKACVDRFVGNDAGEMQLLFGNYHLALGLGLLLGEGILARRRIMPPLVILHAIPWALGLMALANLVWPGLLAAGCLVFSASLLLPVHLRAANCLIEARSPQRPAVSDRLIPSAGIVTAGVILCLLTLPFPVWSATWSLILLCVCVFVWLLSLAWLGGASPPASRTVRTPSSATPTPFLMIGQQAA